LGPPDDLGRDAGRGERAREPLARGGDEGLALGAALLEQAGDLLVELGLEVAERQVLELPLQLPHAEAVRERRVDVERLARDLAALAGGRLSEKAQRLGAAR